METTARMIALRRGSLALALLAAGACASPPERGYYRPAGAAPQPTLQAVFVETDGAALALSCQGVYENVVDGEPTVTVHVQAEITRRSSDPLVLARPGWRVRGEDGDGAPLALRLADVWHGRERIMGDLAVPGFRRRAFDLFFDDATRVGEPLPAWLELSWRGGPGAEGLAGSCRFERIPPGDPTLPEGAPVGDADFGVRQGYYLPGDVFLGERALQPSDEERAHYMHHAPRRRPAWLP